MGRMGARGARTDAAVLLTGAQLRAIRRQLGLTQRELGRRLSYSNHTVSHWETGAKRIPPAVQMRLVTTLVELHHELEELRQAAGYLQATARLPSALPQRQPSV
jgi:transcriptional regulator with XRE-family HTH domain